VKKRSLLTILSCIARTQSQACIAWLQGRTWMVKMRSATNVSSSVGQQISIL
jgi:hypothetical protein